MTTLALALALTVRLYDTAGLGADVLAKAQSTSTEIFQGAGVSLTWVNCASAKASADKSVVMEGACAETPAPSTVLVRIVPQESPIKDALGDSLIDAASHQGTLATIFARNVRAMAERTRTDQGVLFGRAMAHEIDHVLLGSTAHSTAGLMRPHWYDDELLNEKAADWVLSPQDAASTVLAADARVRGATPALNPTVGSGGGDDALTDAVAPIDDPSR